MYKVYRWTCKHPTKFGTNPELLFKKQLIEHCKSYFRFIGPKQMLLFVENEEEHMLVLNRIVMFPDGRDTLEELPAEEDTNDGDEGG